jgi:hypothetical protein
MTIFRIITIDNNKIVEKLSAFEVAAFFLGRRISAYIVIKSDDTGHQIIDVSSANGNVFDIQRLLEAA